MQCNRAALQTHLLVVEVHYDNLGVGHARNVPYVARPGGREVTFALSQVQQAAAQERVKVNDEITINVPLFKKLRDIIFFFAGQ